MTTIKNLFILILLSILISGCSQSQGTVIQAHGNIETIHSINR
ncbi:hypothetical protein VXS03_05660 [Photobacterium sp. S4TG1]|nr:hypothetical protein [Photobacterium sp. S4TG1]